MFDLPIWKALVLLRDIAESSWLIGIDEYTNYANDPKFVESHKELRDLLLTSAQSAAPTRAVSSIADEESRSQLSERLHNVSAVESIISTGERVMWLRNYLEEVAPWVHPLLPLVGNACHFRPADGKTKKVEWRPRQFATLSRIHSEPHAPPSGQGSKHYGDLRHPLRVGDDVGLT